MVVFVIGAAPQSALAAGEVLLEGDLPGLVSPSFESDGSLSRVLLGVTLILFCAKLAGDLAIRLGLPSVLGELTIGVLLGNLTLVGFNGLIFLRADPVLEGTGQLGAVILLFTIGLKSDLRDLARVGSSSILVASVGVFVPLALGTLVSMLFFRSCRASCTSSWAPPFARRASASRRVCSRRLDGSSRRRDESSSGPP